MQSDRSKINNNGSPIKTKLVLTRSGVMGRGEEAEYYISHPSISRRHCEFIVKTQSLQIKDLASKNGTYVNNTRIKETMLTSGDMVQIGKLFFQVGIENEYFILIPCNEIVAGMNQKGKEYTGNMSSTEHGTEEASITQQPMELDTNGTLIDEGKEIIIDSSKRGFRNALDELRRKLGCHALFLIEITPVGSAIREESVVGKYLLSNAVIHYMKEKRAAAKILQPSEDTSGSEEDNYVQGIWAPRELKEPSQSLTGAAENAIYCAPLWENVEKQILLYAYWQDGCGLPRRVEEIVQHEGRLTALWAVERWTEADKEKEYQQAEWVLTESLIGSSPVFLKVIEQIRKLAMTDFSVVLLGPRGCGKTIIAHAIHEISHRKSHPFKAFNCANFQSTLVESELFGSKRGAYTDAVDRKGHLQEADGGTVFIDSIESCPIEVQAKLRDVLEGRPFRAIGGDKDEQVDVRFLAAVNEDPFLLHKENRLRLDFWDRIGVQFIQIPPLWQRLSDIPALAFHFLEREKKKCVQPSTLKGFSPDAIKMLESYFWPGNVRELCNVISRLLILVEDEIAGEADVINAISVFKNQRDFSTMKNIFDLSYDESCRMFESLYVQHKLEEAGNNKSKAAELANLSRRTFYDLLKKLGV